jgi:hypothetical protein
MLVQRWATRMLAGFLVCLGVPAQVLGQHSVMAADSVVLERTLCFGTCPAYRLSVSRSGGVRFESRNPGEERRHAADTVHPRGFGSIVTKADLIDFLALPEQIADDVRFCPHPSTDLPTAIVTVFMPNGSKRVEDNHGCYWAPVGLRQLQDLIDTVTDANRWIRPAARR